MNKIIEKIQNNKSLESFKTGAIKIGYLTIGISIIVLLTHNIKTINLKIFYEISMIIIGFIMVYYISDTLLDKKDESLRLTLMFISLGSLYSFKDKPEFLPAFPVIASLITVLLGNFSKHLNETPLKSKGDTPSAVIDYFNKLIPIMITIFIGVLINIGFDFIFDDFMVLYLKIIKLSSSIFILLLVIILICTFWYLGIHGVTIISSIMRPFWLQMMLFNTYFLITNQPIQFIGTETFLQWFVWLGGSGATLGLSISLRYLSQSKTLKELGQTSFRSNIYNINETIIFGTPIVQNKAFMIPFFLTPLVLGILGYSAIYLGYLNNFTLISPWVLPIPLGALLSSMSIKVLLFSIFLIFVSWLIYFPFFKRYDAKLLKEESN